MIVGAAHLAVGVLALALSACCGFLMRGRRLDLKRSVLIHASVAETWELVRDLPSLHGRFGKAGELGAAQDFTLKAGNGEGEGSIWRVLGQWRGRSYWAEVEIVRFSPREAVGFRLLRDSLGTHRRLLDHLGLLTLQPIDPHTTKLSWKLRARLRGPRLMLARLLPGERLPARLLDQGLRSIKMSAEAVSRHAREAAAREAPQAEPQLSGEIADRPSPGVPTSGQRPGEPGPRLPRPRGPFEPTL